MDIEQRFADALKKLAERRDADSSARATLAALRRGLGKQPGDAPEMYRFVQPRIGVRSPSDENRFYLVASLFAAHQISPGEQDADIPRRANIGASLRQFAGAKPEAVESTERRFSALLQCDEEELADHLRHAVSLLKSEEIPVHWAQLLRDIARWDNPRKYAQRDWARAYWMSKQDDENDPKESETTAEMGNDPNEEGA